MYSSTKLPVTDLNGAPTKGCDSNLHMYKNLFGKPGEGIRRYSPF